MIKSLRIWALWFFFLGLSLLLHLTGTIGFAALAPGEKGPAAGQRTISTIDSLEEILGAQEASVEVLAETVEANPAQETEPVEAVPVVAEATASIEAQKTQRQEDAVPITANAPSLSPVIPIEEIAAEPPETQETERSEEVKHPKKPAQKQVPKKATASQAANKGNSDRDTAGLQKSGAGGTRTATAGSIRSYGLKVRSRIASKKPKHVGQGRVVISLGVSKSGGLRYVQLSKSSGNSKIDRAALRAVRRAAPFPRPPADASLKQLRFVIPFTFR